MLEMYAPMVNSPITELATAIDDTQTTIEVVDGSKLPDAPNLAMIGLGENTETILYTQKDGNVLSGVTRGFQGVAKAWPQGTRVARFFAAYDQMAIQENIKTLDQSLAAHLNDFAQVWANRIVDFGENANGSYVRYENGLQICWASKTVDFELTEQNSQSGNLFFKIFDYPFPATFVGAVVRQYYLQGNAPGIFIGSGFSAITNRWYFTVWSMTQRQVSNQLLHLFAIGRWK